VSPNTHIAARGAVDHYNYGDLLFPLVMREALARFQVKDAVVAYGLVERDLARVGAMPNRSYRRLVAEARQGRVRAIVVVGGEVVGAEWTTMLMHLGSRAQAQAVRVARKLLGRSPANRLAAGSLGAPTAWPWVFSSQELGIEVPILYNAVGGASSWPSLSELQRSQLAAALQSATYLSARDPATQAHLARAGVEGVKLAPDSAVVMSDLWPVETLETMVGPAVRSLADSGPYMVVQANTRVGLPIAARLRAEISEFTADSGLAIVALPIGRAAGHDDAVALTALAAAPNSRSLPDDVSIWEIMYLIGRSSLFLGTSLHGSITALSFGTPHLALTEHVPKLTAHLGAWSLPEFHEPARVGDLVPRCAAAIGVSRSQVEARSAQVREMAWVNLESIAATIERSGAPSAL